jgi:hypothetical protein
LGITTSPTTMLGSGAGMLESSKTERPNTPLPPGAAPPNLEAEPERIKSLE